ncbi:conserved domain protein [Bacteroides clarus YIT 12056]|uniref:Conserved domain protein n=1 Tax=Bacteroides clarus YIT 12056 TaxID=762984 RepID=A0ABN0CQ21_9BACE|nr:conserved domain protein [Bacteroides clarus YIT 12056]
MKYFLLIYIFLFIRDLLILINPSLSLLKLTETTVKAPCRFAPVVSLYRDHRETGFAN